MGDLCLKILEIAKKNGIDLSLVDPHIYYLNGNDSTGFDWDVNDRTCEFGIFYKDGSHFGAVRAWIEKSGDLAGYVYPAKDGISWNMGDESIEFHEPWFQDEEAALEFCDYLIADYDRQGIWDESIWDIEEGM